MKKLKLLIIACLAFAFLACTAATEQNKADDKPKDPTAEKKEEPKTASDQSGLSTPTETAMTFVEAIKKKDGPRLRSCLSKSSIEFFQKNAKDKTKSIEEILIENFEDEPNEKAPEMRNEKIEGDSATIEMRDPGSDKWDMVPFVKEDGVWKIAFDEIGI